MAPWRIAIVMGTRTEAMKIAPVFIEANACGKPVIAGIEGRAGSAKIDARTGLRVDGTKVEEVERGILAIPRSPEFGSRLRQVGLARALESFSCQRGAATARDVLHDLGTQRRSRRSRPIGERRRCGTF